MVKEEMIFYGMEIMFVLLGRFIIFFVKERRFFILYSIYVVIYLNCLIIF